MENFDILFGKSNNRSPKIKQWEIKIKIINSIPNIIINTGFLDGKKIEHILEIDQGKNIGKKNETTPIQQANLVATKKWNNKIEKEGYVKDIKDLSTKEHISPMLAQTFNSKNEKKLNFPIYCQPKLDGIRCMSFINKNKVLLNTRKGKEILNLNHIKEEISKNKEKLENIYLDGELYNEDLPFEEITGIIRKEKEDKIKEIKIIYYIYDYYNNNQKDQNYKNRLEKIKDIFFNCKFIKIIENCEIKNIKEIEEKHQKFINKGFEGIMLRNIDSKYEINKRSYHLQKYKHFLDKEFKIKGYHQSSGRDKDTIIWECEYIDIDNNSNLFSVKPKGNLEFRKTLLKDANKDFSKFKDKQLTVKFQEYSKNLCPRFPVGIGIRWDI